jgi:MFS family permease
MTSPPDAVPPPETAARLHPIIRRALWLLGTAYALGWLTIGLAVGPGSAVVVDLSGRLDAAGYFIAAYYVGAASGGALFGRAMDVWGRRPLLVAAYGTAAGGFALAGAAVQAASLTAFLVGDVILAAGLGGIHLTRVAAAEMFPAAGRGRAVGRIQASALAGALAGPLLLPAFEPAGRWLHADAVALTWFASVPVLVLAMLLARRAPETRAIARDLATYHPDATAASRPRATTFQPRPLVTGIASLALANAAMVMAMGVTGAALRHDGHGVTAIGLALAAHFLGMFALSPLVGRLTDRLGRRATILSGFALTALGGVLIALVPGVVGFSAGIFLVGLGWSGAYIGGTVLVTDATPADRSARVLGLTDTAGAGLTISASIGGGAWYAAHGLPGLGLLAGAIVILPALLVWTLREPRPGVYGAPVVSTG